MACYPFQIQKKIKNKGPITQALMKWAMRASSAFQAQ